MKSLYLTFEQKEFDQLKHCKEMYEKVSKLRVSWEDFVFKMVTNK